MTIVRWILWISVGGAVLWLYQRLFGSELPQGIVTPEMVGDPASQVGERGTGVASGARVASWRTLFTSQEERDNATGESSTTLETFVTLGESCTPPGEVAYGPLTYLTTGGTSQVIAQCKNGYGVYSWVQIGVENKD